MRKILFLAALFLLAFATMQAQNIPSPKSHFGFNIGDNYHLATFTQTEAYFKKLAAASNKVKLQVIGKTEEGRNQYMLIVSDPSNIKQLDKFGLLDGVIIGKAIYEQNISLLELTNDY